MRGTRIEKEVEIYAKNLANKTQVHEHQCKEMRMYIIMVLKSCLLSP
jgi:hypothetical protein